MKKLTILITFMMFLSAVILGTELPAMVLVEAGTFQMGDEHGDLWSGCRPVHTVILTNDYYIGKTEVTFNEYDAYCEAAGLEKPSDYSSVKGGYMGRGNKPVINLSWYDAIAYCNWLSEQEGLAKAYDSDGNLLDKNGQQTTDITQVEGYRLPTEAEWEYAARGGHKSTEDYKYPGSNVLDEVGWYWKNSGVKILEGAYDDCDNDTMKANKNGTQKVGQKVPNELGLYDMGGNVLEWCQDYMGIEYYNESPTENPVNLNSSPYRVLRGGSWGDDAICCRVARRSAAGPSDNVVGRGLRVARTRK